MEPTLNHEVYQKINMIVMMEQKIFLRALYLAWCW